jgi:UDP-glucose 4-epimerase
MTDGSILITGGMGYVGGRMAAHLSQARPEMPLRIMTRRPADKWPDWAADMDVVNADVLDSSSLHTALEGVEIVIHLAAVNENDCIRDPDLALEVNGRGTYLLLQACQEQNVNRMIYFSTFHVYGPGAIQPITELTATRPVHPYAFTHRLAEDYVNWFRLRDKMETMIVRLSNGFGYPADTLTNRWTLVFNDMCTQAVETGEVRLRSKGTQHRDFITLGDLARGTEHLLSLGGNDWGDGLLNLGGDCSLSIYQAAEHVAAAYQEMYGKELPIRLGDADDPAGAGPVEFSIQKLKQSGFTPTGDISGEVKGTLAVCQKIADRKAQ